MFLAILAVGGATITLAQSTGMTPMGGPAGPVGPQWESPSASPAGPQVQLVQPLPAAGQVKIDWLRRPNFEQFAAAWPAAAQAKGIGGSAEIQCGVTISGILEQCRVLTQSPPDMGFGAAALFLAPTFVMTPPMGPNGPRRGTVRIPINFKAAPSSLPQGGGGVFGADVMVNHPVWVAAATFAEVAGAYPKQAAGMDGYVALRCRVDGNSLVKDCQVVQESPPGKGFAKAAKTLTGHFRARLDGQVLKERTVIWVNLPVRFFPPQSADYVQRRIAEPSWVVGLDPHRMAKLFPPVAAAKGLKTGRGVAACLVGAGGALTDCRPMPADPADLGFSEAAVKVASVMRMNLWTDAGGPVDGASVNLPIRFNLAIGAPAPAAAK